MLQSRFNKNIVLYLFIAVIASFLISLFLFQIFAAILILLWLLENNKEKKKAVDKIGYLFLAFALIRIISVFTSQFFDTSVHLLYKDAIFFLSLFAMNFYLKSFDDDELKTLLFSFVIAATFVAVVGLIRFVTGNKPRAQSFGSSGSMVYSTYLLIALAFATLLFPLIRKSLYKNMWLVSTALVISGIFTSFVRTNILVSIIVFITGVFIAKLKLKYALIIVLFAVIIVCSSLQLNSYELNKRVNSPAYLSDRYILLNDAINLIKKFDSPFIGYGPRTFNKIFTSREKLLDRKVGSWHNDIIQIYVESGLLGLISYFTLIGYTLGAGIGLIKKGKLSAQKRLIIFGAVISIIALMLSSLTSGFITSPVIPVVLAFLLSVISAFKFPVENSA